MAKIIGDELRTPTISEVNEAISNIDNTSDLSKPISNATQEAINNLDQKITSHVSNKNNPHGVTKAQVGLGNVDNTSDLNKPISIATKEALDNKANLDHTHKYSTILDTPTALKNPEPLIIQGNEYDGSVRTEINIQNSSLNVFERVISEITAGNGNIITGIIPLNFNITQYCIIRFNKLYKDSILDIYSDIIFFPAKSIEFLLEKI